MTMPEFAIAFALFVVWTAGALRIGYIFGRDEARSMATIATGEGAPQ